jgi:hypothetical protein
MSPLSACTGDGLRNTAAMARSHDQFGGVDPDGTILNLFIGRLGNITYGRELPRRFGKHIVLPLAESFPTITPLSLIAVAVSSPEKAGPRSSQLPACGHKAAVSV